MADVDSDSVAPQDISSDDGVARGKDALTVLDNPVTRFQFIDELEEVSFPINFIYVDLLDR